MLLRLAYLGVSDALALLRLLPVRGRDKDIEILALRHQVTMPDEDAALDVAGVHAVAGAVRSDGGDGGAVVAGG
ncbi:hypothetical protein ACFYY3_34105, partial [Streptomyces sp. NPDC001812]